MKKTSADVTKKTNSFPIAVVAIAGIFVLILAFLGAFGFSFVKSKIINKATNNIATLKGLDALKQFTGGGAGGLPGLPGSTIQTKEEGIAACKQSPVDYCYPLVALSFNDMGVCKLAPDPKACEEGALQFKKDFEGDGDGGGITPDENITPPAGEGIEDKELRECKAGTLYQTLNEKVSITGKETLTIEGSRFEMCCWEIAAESSGKFCRVIDQPDSMILYGLNENKNILESATLTKNGQECTFIFEVDGTIANKMCY